MASIILSANNLARLVRLLEKTHRTKKSGMSADAFAKLFYRSREPLDADTAKEISANLAATDKAK